jgi:hypothetical protein
MKSITGSCFLSLGIGLALIAPVLAEEVPAGVFRQSRGPGITAIAAPVEGKGYTFSESAGFTCPTPSLSIGGFGSGGNDWANDFTSYASAGSGISNFGAGVGLTIPLGMKYGKSCYDYAKSLAAKANALSEQAQRDNQLKLLSQCYYLFTKRVNFQEPAFDEGGAFSSLQACRSYNPQMVQGGSNSDNNNSDNRVNKGSSNSGNNNSDNRENKGIPELEPPLSNIPPPSPPKLIQFLR